MTDAILIYDSAQAGAQLGTRGGPGDPRALLFRAGSISIDILIQEGGDGLRIVYGQLVAAGAPMHGVEVMAGDQRAVTDMFGEFSTTLLGGAQPGGFRMQADDRNFLCAIPPLDGADHDQRHALGTHER